MFGRDGLTARSRALQDSWFLKPSLPSLPIELYPPEINYGSLTRKSNNIIYIYIKYMSFHLYS